MLLSPRSLLLLLCASIALPAAATPPPGDLNGDGMVGLPDLSLWSHVYGSMAGDARYDPAADYDGDGAIGPPEYQVFSRAYGSTGDPDTTAPGVFVTLNDIPDEMNDLLVVPPNGFQVTVAFTSEQGSLLDLSSLEIKSSLPIGPHPEGSNLAPLFEVSPERAAWEVPAGSDLARTTHTLTVRVSDLAGNETEASYGFAVRDFPHGAPLGSTQTIFLDFDQNRSLGPEVDFVEDLREFGLSSVSAPALESGARSHLVDQILRRVRLHYGLKEDGSPGPDAVNIVFSASAPAGPSSRLCIGGESAQGGPNLGASTLDENNIAETSDECSPSKPTFGVFPQAIDNLWGAQPAYQDVFSKVDPDLGGTPFGEHPLDEIIADPGFDAANATPEELERATDLHGAMTAFAQVIASATAHEVGHMLGLVAHEAPPAGLYGGVFGGAADHNVTPAGATPAENYLMNQGASIAFVEFAGLGPSGPAVFRPLNWAYLRDRVVLDPRVTGLFPPVELDAVEPETITFTTGSPENQMVTFTGENFLEAPVVELELDGTAASNPVFGITVVDDETATGFVNRFFVTTGLYDVRFVNGDGQVDVLENGLVVCFLPQDADACAEAEAAR